MKTLNEILKACKDINDYKIVTVHTASNELFYVSDKLETSRVEDVEDTNVTIYVDKDGQRGEASFSVYPYMNEEDINNKIKENIANCAFSLNKYFELPKPNKEEIAFNPTNLSTLSLKEVALRVAKAVFKANVSKELTLNATEIFVYKFSTRIINSQGIDISADSYKIAIELIPTYNGKTESVEVYFMYRSGELNEKEITDEVNNQLNLVKARQEAKPLKLDHPVRVLIEETDNIEEGVIDYFISDLHYSSIYHHMNRQNVGDMIQGNNITGDRLSITMCPIVKGACNSSPIDGDGVKLHEIEIIKDGQSINSFGPSKFGQYLGVKNPTGNLSVVSVKPGTLTDDELKKEPYLRCVKFSAIQLEPNSGFFGGEVRLGFYFDGEKEIPVTGFTISGSMHKEKETMRMSNELVSGSNYRGPKFFAFESMDIN